MKINFKTIILIIMAVTATLVTTQNLQNITLHLLLWDTNLPVIAVILISVLCGFAGGYVYKSRIIIKKNKKTSPPEK